MDENKPLPQNNIDNEAKKAIDEELANFLKPKSEQKVIPNAETVGKAAKAENPINVLEDTSAKKPAKSQVGTKRPIIRTYKSDMEETIQEGHLSSINIAVSENKKLLNQTKIETEEGKKWKINKNILIISLVLVVGGALTFIIPYFLVQKTATPAPQIDTVASHALITADLDEKINIASLNLDRVATTLQEHVQQSSTQLGQIKNIVLTQGTGVNEQAITSDAFLKLIKAHIPADLERDLKTEYMFGLHNFNGNQEFLILKVGSYDTAFSGMLSWENNLWQDFTDLFALKDTTAIDTSTSVSTTSSFGSTTATSSVPSDTNINPFVIQVKNFQDASFDNKDCRVVKDANGKILFLYSIVDDNTIVITTSTDTLKEIISRLQQTNVSTQ